MPSLVAGIYALNKATEPKTWMTGTSPAMTAQVAAAYVLRRFTRRTR